MCHESSHINTDECNCPELFTSGAKLVTLAGEGNKITPDIVKAKLAQFVHGEHGAKLAAMSISNVTELGTVYTTEEIRVLTKIAHANNMKCHMDGARFANALVALDCTPAEMTWKAGIDVLSFGGTKNGGMMLEAVVFFDTSLAADFLYRRKRAGQLLSKGRYLSAQMLVYLQDDVWLPNAKRANRLALVLSQGLQKSNRVRLSNPTQANEVFAIMPRKTFEMVTKQGAHFHEWPVDGLAKDEVHCRFVLSFATPEEHVDQLLKLMRDAS
jgi:threonine aldolase